MSDTPFSAFRKEVLEAQSLFRERNSSNPTKLYLHPKYGDAILSATRSEVGDTILAKLTTTGLNEITKLWGMDIVFSDKETKIRVT